MKIASKPAGLRYWMLRTLEECDRASQGFSADPVHDLRVSLRRCRSLADGLMAMDPDPDWKAMKKAGKQLFQRLGGLRDIQIMMEWIDKLGIDKVDLASRNVERAPSPASPATAELSTTSLIQTKTLPTKIISAESSGSLNPAAALLHILRVREIDQKREARAALEEFNRKQWKEWAETLPSRASHIRAGSAVFKHLALERWTTAHELHVTALRNRSQIGFHTLRIGIKRFRYIVENFLPTEHKLWGNDLKRVQDLLGEVHDLDVLWMTAISCHIFPDAASRQQWHDRILKERSKRIDEYRDRTVGPNSRWNTWRAGLPQGKQIHEIALRRMKLWAKALDPDFAHSERVTGLSLQLYDGLISSGLFRSAATSLNGAAADSRNSLQAAALLHDVGKSRGGKGHHKESQNLILKHGTPLGWTQETMSRAALVARFHIGALPTSRHKSLRDLLPDEQKSIIRLAAILRLANALDSTHDGHISSVRIENAASANGSRRTNGFLRKPVLPAKDEAVVISAEGYADGTSTAQTIAAERYLLETVLRRPVIVKSSAGTLRPASTAGTRKLPRRKK